VPVTVPGCWEAQVPDPYGIVTAWYHRRFGLPEGWAGGRLVLRFGAVMYTCEVHVNGTIVGSHEGGYTPFELEVGDGLIRPGSNEIAVRVSNPLNVIADYPVFPEADLRELEALAPGIPFGEIPHGKQTWYSSQSGIWQSVDLERRPSVALHPLRILPDVRGGQAIVDWALDPGGVPVLPAGATIRIDIVGGDGEPGGSTTIVPLPGQQRGTSAVSIADVRLWDIDQPNLYVATATLRDATDQLIDKVSARFGMREIRTEEGRILLNGRPIYLLGALDQDLYPDTISGPPSRAFLDEQMRRTREAGINLLRCHIKVPDPAYLDAADEAGILVWCELPNWLRFSRRAAERGRETLGAMVETLGNHPSIVIWTIINEDWGTRLRYEARDRRWVAQTYDWLRTLDPSRLVVDNSACESSGWPNFHVRSDLADFHVYFGAPDHAGRWRERIADFAGRPAWLWSPHGDAKQSGDEPLVLSEFGSWGLPRPERLFGADGRDPWWSETGRGYFRAAGWVDRFGDLGLDRVWPSAGDLAEATQWHQFETLQYEIGELRRHGAIAGYVVTELCDANWEANGLLDERRGPKAYHDRLADLNAADVVIADMDRRDVTGGEVIAADITLSSYGAPARGGTLTWWLEADGRPAERMSRTVGAWPHGGASVVGRIEVATPSVAAATDAVLHVVVTDDAERPRARNAYRLALLPPASEFGGPLDVAVHEPSGLWGLEARLIALGHRVVDRAGASIVAASELDGELLDHVARGGRALLLVRSGDAIPPGLELARPVGIHSRQLPHGDWPGERSPWDGDWVTSWSWILDEALPGLPVRAPLDFAFQEVMPDHVLTGYDPALHADEVPAGMFAGWVSAPAALVWTFGQGLGSLTISTFRVAPEAGPVASLLLDRLLRHAAGAAPSRRTDVPAAQAQAAQT
jgi:hypothetical protein